MKVRFNNASLFLGAFATLALSGCQVGFHDAELPSLVTRLAKENLDLKSAAERVEQARDARQMPGLYT